jgi:hypothetical protein
MIPGGDREWWPPSNPGRDESCPEAADSGSSVLPVLHKTKVYFPGFPRLQQFLSSVSAFRWTHCLAPAFFLFATEKIATTGEDGTPLATAGFSNIYNRLSIRR